MLDQGNPEKESHLLSSFPSHLVVCPLVSTVSANTSPAHKPLSPDSPTQVILFIGFPGKTLKQMYIMTMDIHKKYKAEACNELVSKFNELLLYSLRAFKCFQVLDNEWTVLPISAVKYIKFVAKKSIKKLKTAKGKSGETGPVNIKGGFKEKFTFSPFIQISKKFYRAKALL